MVKPAPSPAPPQIGWRSLHEDTKERKGLGTGAAIRPPLLLYYEQGVRQEDGFRYVDKTALLYPLVTRGRDSFFFISRPRRFGKSLMLSTLECLFRGERELFKGLAIDKMDYDWESYPILHFNFGTMDVATIEGFKQQFVERIARSIVNAGGTYNPAVTPATNFSDAIQKLAKDRGKPVVILIDEYDAPVGAALNDIAKATDIRTTLSAFYGEIKNNVGNIRFMMMTGVTKFTQLSVFSGGQLQQEDAPPRRGHGPFLRRLSRPTPLVVQRLPFLAGLRG